MLPTVNAIRHDICLNKIDLEWTIPSNETISCKQKTNYAIK